MRAARKASFQTRKQRGGHSIRMLLVDLLIHRKAKKKKTK